MSLYRLLLKLASLPVVGDNIGVAVSRIGINHFARSIPARPRPLSLWSSTPAIVPGTPAGTDHVADYTSWPGLTDRSFSARHLPPASLEYVAQLPPHRVYQPGSEFGPSDAVTQLFVRDGQMRPSRSSLLFMFFAQWFTDSLFRFNGADRRRNTSNHDVDLCEIYGLTNSHTSALRAHAGGRLKSQILDGGEYPEYLCAADAGGIARVRPEFEPLFSGAPTMSADGFVDAMLVSARLGLTAEQLDLRKHKLYATGLERGNSSVGYVAISVIFLREHNRIASELAARNPSWSDERLFQTARNINIVLLLKLIVEDYINHILGHSIFKLDPSFAEEEEWYRPNWIAAEFGLLYRWHGLVPDRITINDRVAEHSEFRFNNGLLEAVGVGSLIDQVSRQQAGRISLGNTPEFLWAAESLSVQMGRDFRLQPFNAYRVRFGLPRIESYSELTSDRALQAALNALYPNIEHLELVVGLFAEEADEGALFGDLLNQMVAYDAFTQIFD